MSGGGSRETFVVPSGPDWHAETASSDQLGRYERFLIEEAILAGGLGPRERDRVADRHLHDALGFAIAWHGESAPEHVMDVGSGVGLPGIPLAVLWPDTRVSLVERSGGRARLLRRALRILELGNAEVIEADVTGLTTPPDAGVVMRAVFPLAETLERLGHLAWERLAVASGPDDTAEWGDRRGYRVFARTGWVRTMRRQ